MAEVHRSVIVPYTPAQMFALVDDVERYPRFLPWCGGAKLLFRDEHTTRATLTIDYYGIRRDFTTENTKRFPGEMQLHLVEGPFRRLDGGWRFIDLGGKGCRVEFMLNYEFAPMFDAMLSPVFAMIAHTLLDAFVQRARLIDAEDEGGGAASGAGGG